MLSELQAPAASRQAAAGRVLRRARGISGALAAPFSQAFSSLVLQVLALRQLGADGFGTYALLYGGLVVLTALSSGLTGDSLTVLDRGHPAVRSALLTVGLSSTLLAGATGALVAWATGLLSAPVALLFGAAIIAFLLEDLTRRMLMAVLQFWRVVVVDVTVLVFTVGVLLALELSSSSGDLSLGQLLLALLVAQAAGAVIGVLLLPRPERRLARLRDTGAIGRVLRFGGWRATQQAIRPTVLLVFRVIIVMAAGKAVFGELEAARVYTSPAMLIVNGTSSFYLASHSTQAHRSFQAVLQRADTGLKWLVGAMIVMAAVAIAATPFVATFVTGGKFPLATAAVAGWMVYAGASATWSPYGSLASVRGSHAFVVGVRLVDAVISLVVTYLLVVVAGAPISVAPFALAAGTLVGVPLIRRRLTRAASRGASHEGVELPTMPPDGQHSALARN